MWAEVQGQYEFDTFENGNGEEIKLVKRIINRVFPLKMEKLKLKTWKVELSLMCMTQNKTESNSVVEKRKKVWRKLR